MLKARWQKFVLALSVVGPAIIAGTANNDAGGISTYSYVGSRFGYAMLWVLLVNFITLACTQEIGIRLGVYTGKGLAALIREQFKIGWTLFALLTLFAANVAVTASEFAGIAAAFELFGVSKWVVVPIFAVLVWVLLYKGSFKKIERLFLFISLFLLVYIISAVLAHPHWAVILKETIMVRMPADFPFLIALLGVMGTTITPWGQFFIQSYVVDKGAGSADYKVQQFEVYFSAFFTCLIAAMIMITTKEVLFDRGIVVDSAASAASALAPVLGSLATVIFGVGFFFASLLGAFILPLTTSYSICEALGFEHGMDTTWKEARAFYGIMAAIIVLSAVFTLQSVFSLFQVMLFAQVVNGILLPVILIFILVLLIRGKRFGLPESSRFGKFFYFVVTGETIVRLIIVSALLIILTLFPSLLGSARSPFLPV